MIKKWRETTKIPKKSCQICADSEKIPNPHWRNIVTFEKMVSKMVQKKTNFQLWPYGLKKTVQKKIPNEPGQANFPL